jgi:alpha-amylase
MLQGFEWYVPDDHRHWKRLNQALKGLKATGVDNIWIPPACKASGPSGNGYDIYDLYDLGEFDTKGSKGTKWGTKEELLQLCKEANDIGIGIYFDAVLNHKAAADNVEKCRVVKVDPNNRNTDISDPYEIEGWLGFDFKARGDKYSSQKYHWYHFSATDYDNATKETAIYRILGDGKHFAGDVDTEKGNFDVGLIPYTWPSLTLHSISCLPISIMLIQKCSQMSRTGVSGWPKSSA